MVNHIDEENCYDLSMQREQKNLKLSKLVHLSKIYKVKVSKSGGNLKNHLFLYIRFIVINRKLD